MIGFTLKQFSKPSKWHVRVSIDVVDSDSRKNDYEHETKQQVRNKNNELKIVCVGSAWHFRFIFKVYGVLFLTDES